VAKYKILIKASAAKEIERLPSRKDRRRVVDRIRSLADDTRPKGCEKLSGQERYRLRQGNYRIIYSIADDVLTVHVVKVGDRKDVYRY
jgi:mRNA interferase RelE/StbE